MTFQDLLILFGAPILVVVAVFTVVFLRHPRPQSRYRAGEPYNFKPVWFVARNGAVADTSGSGTASETTIDDAHGAAALEPAHAESIASGPKGGSHGKW
ncbi:hypothetical protein [Glycomyces harbinensis]|uniref:Uncharacterized protein n=1 Tax=Glycomyces harbinensis TaxID=58114 RepID=A0A1G6SUM4_9ACTN|nr:hypothetical protein [Glycomyces harbinensis]SDD20478.1 hypothetical protein SAMN05216270_102302 [Glycomyces harbinensis]